MKFSAFAPLGLFKLSSERPVAERIYRGIVASHGSDSEFDMTPGSSWQEAKCFAIALAKARVRETLKKALRQAYPGTVGPKVAQMESAYQIVPPYGATLGERRAELVDRTALPDIWNTVRITEALSELLGDDFIAYRPCPLAETARWPTDLGDQPQNLQLPSVANKLLRITQPVSTGLGAPQAVTYELVDAPHGADSGNVDLVVGDSVVVEPEILGITETVTVTAVSATTFTATFTKAHTNNCLGSTAPYPKWITTKRHNLVIVTPTAAVDATKRALVHDRMRRMVRAPSTWSIVQSEDGLVTGTFKVGESPIGAQTIGSITI